MFSIPEKIKPKYIPDRWCITKRQDKEIVQFLNDYIQKWVRTEIDELSWSNILNRKRLLEFYNPHVYKNDSGEFFKEFIFVVDGIVYIQLYRVFQREDWKSYSDTDADGNDTWEYTIRYFKINSIL